MELPGLRCACPRQRCLQLLPRPATPTAFRGRADDRLLLSRQLQDLQLLDMLRSHVQVERLVEDSFGASTGWVGQAKVLGWA